MNSLLEMADPSRSFKKQMYIDALNYTECDKQLNYLANSSMLLPFLDATGKIPSGILTLNHMDYGDYFECLGINNYADDMHIEGKYCIINIPPTQNITMPSRYKMIKIPEFSFNGFSSSNPVINNIINSVDVSEIDSSLVALNMGSCIPKVCSVKQVSDYILSSGRFPKVEYIEGPCRLPGDKFFTTSDYVALAVFGMLFLLTILSTSYDLYNVYVKKSKSTNRFLTSFSVYTNTKRLLKFEYNKYAMDCVDGIRALSMLWVIFGHTYVFQIFFPVHNALDFIQWSTEFTSTWINAAPMVVDTFFTLSGLFCIYSLPNKLTPLRFLKSLHLFYLYRYWRTFPVMATVVLLQISVFHWISDGPYWDYMAFCVDACRSKWWATLFHIQNYIRPIGMCIPQSWYVTVDTQLYLLSPIVIVFLLMSTTLAWLALATALIVTLIILAYYTIKYDFPAILNGLWESQKFVDYFVNFYINTATRASPFVVGMMFGYILWSHKKKGRIQISLKFVIFFWSLAFKALAYIFLTTYSMAQVPYQLGSYDVFVNIILRATWAATIGWIILACSHGYGGPINWFLSLRMWKLPSRVSYAVYMIHLQVIMISNSSAVKPNYFTEMTTMYYSANFIVISLIFGIIISVLVDGPSSTILKLCFGTVLICVHLILFYFKYLKGDLTLFKKSHSSFN